MDMMRGVGAERIKFFTDSEEAMDALGVYAANIIIAAVESLPVDGVAWTRAFRRNLSVKNRRASVFLTSRAFSRSLAEDCRHAGANALIGKPLSAKILTDTIRKVLANPRPFIEAEKYVGPCRRAGIITAGGPVRRRKADAEGEGPQVGSLAQALVTLGQAVDAMLDGKADPAVAEGALKRLQAYAVAAGDGPMMRACAAMNLQLKARATTRPEAAREALAACVAGMTELAGLDRSNAGERELIAESVRLAVAKAAKAAA
ncbi:MAG: hypothetical protein NW206_16350 [Hyphomonadaceae bacterium]|nr:hypothetical protein [Hyphomonadaceae bacterium]